MKTQHLSNLVLLRMETLQGVLENDVEIILKWAKQLEHVDLTPLEKSHKITRKNTHHNDDIKDAQKQDCNRETLLKNASKSHQHFFVVPKVL